MAALNLTDPIFASDRLSNAGMMPERQLNKPSLSTIPHPGQRMWVSLPQGHMRVSRGSPCPLCFYKRDLIWKLICIKGGVWRPFRGSAVSWCDHLHTFIPTAKKYAPFQGLIHERTYTAYRIVISKPNFGVCVCVKP